MIKIDIMEPIAPHGCELNMKVLPKLAIYTFQN